jgi:hypothetical protein
MVCHLCFGFEAYFCQTKESIPHYKLTILLFQKLVFGINQALPYFPLVSAQSTNRILYFLGTENVSCCNTFQNAKFFNFVTGWRRSFTSVVLPTDATKNP